MFPRTRKGRYENTEYPPTTPMIRVNLPPQTIANSSTSQLPYKYTSYGANSAGRNTVFSDYGTSQPVKRLNVSNNGREEEVMNSIVAHFRQSGGSYVCFSMVNILLFFLILKHRSNFFLNII